MKLQNPTKLKEYIRQQGMLIEAALIYNLEALVSELVTHAKMNAGYTDQTSNLKSSIGGVVLKDGKPIGFRGFEGVQTGTGTGMEFITSLFPTSQNGYTVIIVAGMEYATYVENYHNLNVLKKSELIMGSKLQELVEKLKQKIK